MTDDRIVLIEAFQKADDGNLLRSLAETVLLILMEADVDGLIGTVRYERSGERSTYRNGYRERSLDTRLGSLNLSHRSAASDSVITESVEEIDRRLPHLAPTPPCHLRGKAT